jgi:hypothetical protein
LEGDGDGDGDGEGEGEGAEDQGVKTVEVPWARPGSGFTLLMEAMMVLLTGHGMTVAGAFSSCETGP